MPLHLEYVVSNGKTLKTLTIDNTLYIMKVDKQDAFEVDDDLWDSIIDDLKRRYPSVDKIEALSMSLLTKLVDEKQYCF